jgi:glycosyltransferase involved in cell wall biosynthesis
MLLTVVIPVYNEDSTIDEVIEKIRAVNIPKEIVVVNDGSTDGTKNILDDAWANNRISFVHNSPVNQGKGASVRIGFKHAKGDLVIIQDADLELDPNEYYKLVEPFANRDVKVVYGSRFLKSGRRVSIINLLANKLLVFLTNLMYGCSLTDMETAYKVFRREVIKDIKLECNGFDFEPEVTAKILKKGIKIVEIPIEYHPRTREEGKKVNWKDGMRAIWCLLRFRF